MNKSVTLQSSWGMQMPKSTDARVNVSAQTLMQHMGLERRITYVVKGENAQCMENKRCCYASAVSCSDFSQEHLNQSVECILVYTL